MEVSIAPASFRPVTIVLDTQDEVDKLIAVLSGVAENRINHTPPVIRAAIDLRADLVRALDANN
jgi:hypothetical protein